MVLRLRSQAPENWSGAKCLTVAVADREYDPFFSEDEEETQDAINFCNGEIDNIICPIREKCLLFALTNNERFGVWGGTSEITRKAIRKRWPARGPDKNNKEWKWLPEKEALKGLSREKLMQEEEDV